MGVDQPRHQQPTQIVDSGRVVDNRFSVQRADPGDPIADYLDHPGRVDGVGRVAGDHGVGHVAVAVHRAEATGHPDPGWPLPVPARGGVGVGTRK